MTVEETYSGHDLVSRDCERGSEHSVSEWSDQGLLTSHNDSFPWSQLVHTNEVIREITI
jgi:hypothetical protein